MRLLWQKRADEQRREFSEFLKDFVPTKPAVVETLIIKKVDAIPSEPHIISSLRAELRSILRELEDQMKLLKGLEAEAFLLAQNKYPSGVTRKLNRTFNSISSLMSGGSGFLSNLKNALNRPNMPREFFDKRVKRGKEMAETWTPIIKNFKQDLRSISGQSLS